MYKIVTCFLTAIYLLLSFQSAAQQSDEIAYKSSLDATVALFKTEVNANLQLYNGSEYNVTGHNIIGFPYFETESLVPASISYGHNFYINIPVHYDIVRDLLVIKDYQQNYFIKLISSDVDSFFVLNHLFVRLEDGANSSLITPGFYQKLYTGSVSIYAKRQKSEVQSINEGVAESKYVQTNTYFLQKNGLFYEIDNEHSLFDILIDKKALLKKFVRENKIDFKNDFENEIVKTAEYYSGLK